MQIYDVSVGISPELPVWPGHPGISLERVRRIEDGANANESVLGLNVHAGTHVDAPLHFVEDGAGVEELPLRVLTGRAYVVDIPNADVLSAEVLSNAGIPSRTKRVLFKTSNSKYWANQEKEFKKDYVGVDASGAEWLVAKKVQLVGVDYLSVAPYGESRPTHTTLLENQVVVIEGLNLSNIRQGRYALYCLPLKLVGSDGAPARTILVGV